MTSFKFRGVTNLLLQADKLGLRTTSAPPEKAPVLSEQDFGESFNFDKFALKYDALLKSKTGATTSKDLDELFQKYTAEAPTVGDSESPNTVRNRRYILQRWRLFMKTFAPDLDWRQHWSFETVEKSIMVFLPYMIETTPPRPRYNTIKGSTVVGWFKILVTCVLMYTFDEQGNEAGTRLLADLHYCTKLKNQIDHLCREHKLSRVQNPKKYCGELEMQAILRYMLKNSEQEGGARGVILQHGSQFLITYVSAAQPSGSLGYTHRKWLEHEYIPQLKDLDISHIGDMKYSTLLNLEQVKGFIDAPTTEPLVITLESASKAHNTLFDVNTWLICDLFNRGVLDGEYDNVMDVFNDPSPKIYIRPDKLNEPLFLEIATGGNALGTRAASSRTGTDAFSRLCVKLGYGAMSLYSVRRHRLNPFIVQSGTEFGQLVAGHTNKTNPMIVSNYTRGAANIDVIHQGLDKEAGQQESYPGHVEEQEKQRQLLSSLAVEACIGTLKNADTTKKSVKQKAAEDYAKEYADIEASEEMVDLQTKLDNAWDRFRSCFTERTQNDYSKTIGVTTLMMDLASGRKKTSNTKRYCAFATNITEDDVKPLLKNLRDINNQHQKLRAKLRHRAADQARRQKARGQTNAGSSAPTVEERQPALKEASTPPSVLLDAVEDAYRSQDLDAPVTADPLSSPEEYCEQVARVADYLETEILTHDFQETPGLFNHFVKTYGLDYDGFEEEVEEDSKEVELEDTQHDVDEDREMDIYNLPAADVKRAFVAYLMRPIMEERQRRQHTKTGKNGKIEYYCVQCQEDPYYCQIEDKMDRTYESASRLTRHINACHTPWVKYVHSMLVSGTQSDFVCACGNYKSTSEVSFRNHLVSYKCTLKKKHEKLHKQHLDLAKSDDKSKAKATPNIDVNLPQVSGTSSSPNQEKEPQEHPEVPSQDVDAPTWLGYRLGEFPRLDPVATLNSLNGGINRHLHLPRLFQWVMEDTDES